MAGQIPPEIGVLVYMSTYIAFFNAQSGRSDSDIPRLIQRSRNIGRRIEQYGVRRAK